MTSRTITLRTAARALGRALNFTLGLAPDQGR